VTYIWRLVIEVEVTEERVNPTAESPESAETAPSTEVESVAEEQSSNDSTVETSETEDTLQQESAEASSSAEADTKVTPKETTKESANAQQATQSLGKKKVVRKLAVGQEVTGTIKRVAEFGAFVDRAILTSSWKLTPNSVCPKATCLSAAAGSDGIWISRSSPCSWYQPLSKATYNPVWFVFGTQSSDNVTLLRSSAVVSGSEAGSLASGVAAGGAKPVRSTVTIKAMLNSIPVR